MAQPDVPIPQDAVPGQDENAQFVERADRAYDDLNAAMLDNPAVAKGIAETGMTWMAHYGKPLTLGEGETLDDPAVARRVAEQVIKEADARAGVTSFGVHGPGEGVSPMWVTRFNGVSGVEDGYVQISIGNHGVRGIQTVFPTNGSANVFTSIERRLYTGPKGNYREPLIYSFTDSQRITSTIDPQKALAAADSAIALVKSIPPQPTTQAAQ